MNTPRSFLLRFAFGLAASAFAVNGSSAAEPALPPVSDFLKEGVFEEPNLSPGGDFLAAMFTTEKDLRGVTIIDVQAMKPSHRLPTDERSVMGYAWLGDQHLIAFLDYRRRHLSGGVIVDATGKQMMLDLYLGLGAALGGVPAKTPLAPYLWLDYTAYDDSPIKDEQFRQKATERLGGRPRPTIPYALARIDGLKEMASRRYQKPEKILETLPSLPAKYQPLRFWANSQGQPSLALAELIIEDPRIEVTYKANYPRSYHLLEDGQWRPLNQSVETFELVGWWAKDTEIIGFKKNAGSVPVLIRLDPRTGQELGVLFQDSRYSPAQVRRVEDPATGALAAIDVIRTRPERVWFDTELKEFERSLASRFPQQRLTVQDWNRQRTVFLLKVDSARQAPSYFLLDLEKKQMVPVGDSRPWHKADQLSPSELVPFKTRDGFALQAFLTLPRHHQGQGLPPLVVYLPHGPDQVQSLAWDGMVQLLASRGFAVLRVNYRGSLDFPHLFTPDDRLDGQKMANDVNDAVAAVLAMQKVDATRVALHGRAFGAYLALAAASELPSRYRAVSVYNPIMDWERYLKRDYRQIDVSHQEYFMYQGRQLVLSSVDSFTPEFVEKARLENLESRVGAISCPLLILTNEDVYHMDTRQAYELRSALRKGKAPVRLVDREAHWDKNYRLRFDVELIQEMEKFFTKELAPSP